MHEVIAVQRNQRRQVVILVSVDLHNELPLLRRDTTVGGVVDLTTRMEKEVVIRTENRRQSLQDLRIRERRLKRPAIRRHLLVVNDATRR